MMNKFFSISIFLLTAAKFMVATQSFCPMTNMHSLILCAVWLMRRQQGFFVCCCSRGHVTFQSPDIEVFLHGALACLFWLSPLSFALRAVLVMELEGMQQTCPSLRRVCMIFARVSIPVLFLISLFEFFV